MGGSKDDPGDATSNKNSENSFFMKDLDKELDNLTSKAAEKADLELSGDNVVSIGKTNTLEINTKNLNEKPILAPSNSGNNLLAKEGAQSPALSTTSRSPRHSQRRSQQTVVYQCKDAPPRPMLCVDDKEATIFRAVSG